MPGSAAAEHLSVARARPPAPHRERALPRVRRDRCMASDASPPHCRPCGPRAQCVRCFQHAKARRAAYKKRQAELRKLELRQGGGSEVDQLRKVLMEIMSQPGALESGTPSEQRTIFLDLIEAVVVDGGVITEVRTA